MATLANGGHLAEVVADGSAWLWAVSCAVIGTLLTADLVDLLCVLRAVHDDSTRAEDLNREATSTSP